MKKLNYLFLVVIFLSACRKDKLPDESIISQYSTYWNSNQDGKRLFELRCALAKTVAKALQNDEFRQYFKDNFGEAKNGHFPELVLAQYLNVTVKSDGTTLYDLLLESSDLEVKELFGVDFLNQVLEHDPMVVIKLPDEFRCFNWDVDEVIPMVIPFTSGSAFGSEGRFIAYFHDGSYDIISNSTEYLHVTVKYSEDYTLLNRSTFLNEKDISFYEFIPQGVDCINFQQLVINTAVPHYYFTDMIVVHKMTAYQIWSQNCGFKGNYLSENSCQVQCPRECIALPESRWILDSLFVNSGLIFQLGNKSYLEDSYVYSFQFWSVVDTDVKLYRVCIPAMPNAYFDAFEYEIVLQKKGKCYPPKIDFKANKKKRFNSAFYVGAEIFDFVQSAGSLVTSINQLVYSDLVNQVEVAGPAVDLPQKLHPSDSYHVDTDAVPNCSLPLRIGGQIEFSVTF